MNWTNVKLIFQREMRDQLRDRRTLFLIAILPLLLYPLMGMSFFQMAQFLRKEAAKVLVVGAEQLDQVDWLPPLLDGDHFHPDLFANPQDQQNIQVVRLSDLAGPHPEVSSPPHPADNGSSAPSALPTRETRDAPSATPRTIVQTDSSTAFARQYLASGEVQVLLTFPPGFVDRLRTAHESLVSRKANNHATDNPSDDSQAEPLPEPLIYYHSANESSQLAQMRIERLLQRWRERVTHKNLSDHDIPLDVANPFQLQPRDVAHHRQRQTAIWSKILPFVLFVWALTGAFYPAVDLCAGEKERGTLETLLASPAQRREIVWGKLLTVMLFSVVTALLNMASMGFTGKFVLSQLSSISGFSGGEPLVMPPMISLLWLVVGLLPISAIFSALCLALAAFARSTKEGQYYLMPLVLVTLPLMLLPMAPGVELNLGNSLIPVTGVILLLRSMIEGQYAAAIPYILPVVVVTLACCLLAIRWAEEQFNRESVLFRESERLDLSRWVAHLVRDRTETPTVAQAIFCFVTIIVVQFFIGLALSAQSSGPLEFPLLAQILFISQVVCILLPPAMMTLMLVRRRKKTLLLDRVPRISHCMMAVAMAMLVHPLGLQFTDWVHQLYPISSEVNAQVEAISQAMSDAPYWWIPLLLMALLPAVCEEFAFRGFILSGFRHVGHKWWAILGTAIAFGAVHPFLQQKISAAAVGIFLGILAVQTASLIPCILFHAVYNGLALATGHLATILEDGRTHPILQVFMRTDGISFAYRPWFAALCGVGAALILWGLHRRPYERTEEEQLEEKRQHQGLQT